MKDSKLIRLIRKDANRKESRLKLVKAEDGNFYLVQSTGKAYRIDEKQTYLNIDRLKKEIGYKKPDKTPQKKRGVIDLGGDYDD